MNHQKGFANIAIIILVIVALAGVVGYFTLVKKSEPVAQQTPTSTQTQKSTPPTPTPTPTYHDVKYFYDTTPFPKPGEPLSDYHDKATIRGRLTTTDVATNCIIAPCPDPGIKAYYLTDINNENYKIMIRGTWDVQPIIKDLKVGRTYIISGTLEHGYNYKNELGFVFDAEKVY